MSGKPAFEKSFEMGINHNHLQFRRMKIVATIGPSSRSLPMLKKLISAGLNVARINFSHGDAREHVKVMADIRKSAKQLDTSVAILADLCGPKIRVGKFKNGSITLKENSIVNITVDKVTGNESLIPSQYRRLAMEVKTGDPVLVDDESGAGSCEGGRQRNIKARL